MAALGVAMAKRDSAQQKERETWHAPFTRKQQTEKNLLWLTMSTSFHKVVDAVNYFRMSCALFV